MHVPPQGCWFLAYQCSTKNVTIALNSKSQDEYHSEPLALCDILNSNTLSLYLSDITRQILQALALTHHPAEYKREPHKH